MAWVTQRLETANQLLPPRYVQLDRMSGWQATDHLCFAHAEFAGHLNGHLPAVELKRLADTFDGLLVSGLRHEAQLKPPCPPHQLWPMHSSCCRRSRLPEGFDHDLWFGGTTEKKFAIHDEARNAIDPHRLELLFFCDRGM